METTPIHTNDPLAAPSVPDEHASASASAPETWTVPTQEDTEGWQKLYRTLGCPRTPEEYGPFTPDTPGQDPLLESWFKQAAHTIGLSKRQATELAAAWSTHQNQQQEHYHSTLTEKSEEALHHLKKEWGAEFEDHIASAKRAVTHYSIASDELDALETVLGTHRMLSLCAQLGRACSEPAFVGTTGNGGNAFEGNPQETIRQLIQDTSFMTRYLNGEKEAVARMQHSMQQAYPS